MDETAHPFLTLVNESMIRMCKIYLSGEEAAEVSTYTTLMTRPPSIAPPRGSLPSRVVETPVSLLRATTGSARVLERTFADKIHQSIPFSLPPRALVADKAGGAHGAGGRRPAGGRAMCWIILAIHAFLIFHERALWNKDYKPAMFSSPLSFFRNLTPPTRVFAAAGTKRMTTVSLTFRDHVRRA